MDIKETPPSDERQGLINAVVRDAAQFLGVDNQKHTPKEIITTINQTIEDLVFARETPIPTGENSDLLLGALWGAQLQRQFNWYWADVMINDEIPEVALISPKQEMIIFPFSFVGACINKQCISTVELAFNMLLENKQLQTLPQGGYENIMLGIHHVIPPYTLEN